MKMRTTAMLVWVVGCISVFAQTAPAPVGDAGLNAASLLIGKALFLRGFYGNNDLTYDAAGRVHGSPRVVDWTLAAMNVLKVERRGAGEIELEGIRAAVRYNPDNHEFQRHALNDEKIRVIVAETGDAKRLEAAFAAIFSVGIDPALQRTMLSYWRHYFDPSFAWPSDSLNGQTVYALNGAADQAKDVIAPTVQHRVEAKYSEFALRDKVQGAVQLRMVVDANGVPQRIAIARPLGYGLDAEAVEAMTKWRFTPAMHEGSPVAATVLVEEQFTLVGRTR
jgi:TonB family protein